MLCSAPLLAPSRAITRSSLLIWQKQMVEYVLIVDLACTTNGSKYFQTLSESLLCLMNPVPSTARPEVHAC
jgi:hypothetical protein